MSKRLVLFILICGSATLAAQTERERAALTEVWSPAPPVVTPGLHGSPPSDAIVLFDGRSLDAWAGADGGPARWDVSDGTMTVRAGTGDIHTKQSFGDVQLHVEWRTPAPARGSGQDRGNSGVYLMSRYEVQVLDSYGNETYANGQAGSIYKQHIPLANASRPPGEWQVYDIVFRAPRFDGAGKVTEKATLTVLHNGVLIQNHAPLEGSTVWIGEPVYESHGPKAPLLLQDHDHPVSYRNLWVRELPETPSLP